MQRVVPPSGPVHVKTVDSTTQRKTPPIPTSGNKTVPAAAPSGAGAGSGGVVRAIPICTSAKTMAAPVASPPPPPTTTTTTTTTALAAAASAVPQSHSTPPHASGGGGTAVTVSNNNRLSVSEEAKRRAEALRREAEERAKTKRLSASKNAVHSPKDTEPTGRPQPVLGGATKPISATAVMPGGTAQPPVGKVVKGPPDVKDATSALKLEVNVRGTVELHAVKPAVLVVQAESAVHPSRRRLAPSRQVERTTFLASPSARGATVGEIRDAEPPAAIAAPSYGLGLHQQQQVDEEVHRHPKRMLLLKEEESQRRKLQRLETVGRAAILNEIVDKQQTLNRRLSYMDERPCSRNRTPLCATGREFSRKVEGESHPFSTNATQNGTATYNSRPENTRTPVMGPASANITTLDDTDSTSPCPETPSTALSDAARDRRRQRRLSAVRRRRHTQLMDMPPFESGAHVRSLIASQVLPENIDEVQPLRQNGRGSRPRRHTHGEDNIVSNDTVPTHTASSKNSLADRTNVNQPSSPRRAGLWEGKRPYDAVRSSKYAINYMHRARRPSRTPSPTHPDDRKINTLPSSRSAVVSRPSARNEMPNRDDDRDSGSLPPLTSGGRRSNIREGTWMQQLLGHQQQQQQQRIQ
ncbi:hypothetical protein DQ04_00801100 [Trypanosoma grayi]|uniref:hypothetical protein n=1 Tax=Trypanosoma grayi TaxID=71804 RepID=UPI0004F45D50|nr:hypothetical protein DQ04_00801100 [Trypanosoma grayi]KEG13769.1 hypothetical protein DQ04_00801100 [Trypanosoma grayi]